MQEQHLPSRTVQIIQLGRDIGALLSPHATPSFDTLRDLLPILLQSGAAGLAWKRVELQVGAEEAAALQELYRREALFASLQERELSRCANLLQSNGVRCLFGKGWRVARCYPGWGLRACGDIDLYVDKEQLSLAKSLLGDDASWAVSLDLHDSCREFSAEPLSQLWERSEVIELRGVSCRFIPPEEHLCLLAFHSLRHGLSRPVWLLDIGFWLREFSEKLKWDFMERLSPLQLHYLKAVAWLSHVVFGFEIPGQLSPIKSLPRWVLDDVYRAWGRPYWARVPVGSLWSEPLTLLREVPRHWPNAIESVYEERLRFEQISATTQAAVFLNRSRKLFAACLKKDHWNIAAHRG